MPSTISQLPRGLLAELGIQSFGESPKSLSDQVAGVLELGDLYRLNSMEIGTGSDTAPALGSRGFDATTGGTIDLRNNVPAGEVWYLHSYHLTVQAGAATSITVQPRLSGQGVSMAYTLPYAITGSAGSPPIHVPFGRSGFWIPPLSGFGYLVSAITGAPGAVVGIAWVSRYKA